MTRTFLNPQQSTAERAIDISRQRIRMSPMERRVLIQKFATVLSNSPPRGTLHPANVDLFVRTRLDSLRQSKRRAP